MSRYANLTLHSDAWPFEVTRTVSEKTLDIRAMAYELDPAWRPEMHAGGFAAHCSNQHSQRWIITSDESKPTTRIRLHRDGTWRDSHGNLYRLAEQPRRFHDYNF